MMISPEDEEDDFVLLLFSLSGRFLKPPELPFRDFRNEVPTDFDLKSAASPLPVLILPEDEEDDTRSLFDERSEARSLNPSDFLSHASKIADLLHNTDVSYFWAMSSLTLKGGKSSEQDHFMLNVKLQLFALIAKQPAFHQLRSERLWCSWSGVYHSVNCKGSQIH